MTDILKRLRMYQRPGNLMEEAADEIERLRDGLARAVQHLEYLEQSGRGDMIEEQLASLRALLSEA